MVEHYDVILVGTGFASSFFLQRLLVRSPRSKILVLERGGMHSQRWQLNNRGHLDKVAEESVVNRHPTKRWPFTLAFGGSSNCWWACTPRMFPDDFRLQSTYGIGIDWPLDYSDLESYYTEVEETMQVSGPQDSPFPRSRPYPLPPHRFSSPDKLLKAAFPHHFFQQPTARPSQNVSTRIACCNTGVCSLCPIDAKFTILNSFSSIYESSQVTLITGAEVKSLDVRGKVAQGVFYEHGGKEFLTKANLIALGANGIFNPYLLQCSGLDGPHVGQGLVEQASIFVDVYLDGLDNFDGGTAITGHGYNFYSGVHRKDHAAMMIETFNLADLRMERGKWRQILRLRAIFEDLRQEKNKVQPSPEKRKPSLHFTEISPYTKQAIERAPEKIEKFIAPLPVERVEYGPLNPTEAHVIGTTVMGNDPALSVIDRDLVHHQVRNLLLLGSGAFPTAAPANPTLTLCALSLRSADQLFS